jgi:hypothetical protein
MIEVFISTNDTDYQEVFASYQQRVISGGGTIDSLSCLSTGLLGLDARGFAANKLDLAPDFDIAITRSIADIRNPEQRSSDYTKTLTIPATKNNNQIFGHIFEVANEITGTGQYTPDFNPNKKADCFVTADGIEQIRGFIRLTEIIVENNNLIGYNCTIHGETANLFTSIENAKLADLDFSEYNHVLNITNVTNSWDTQIIVDGSPEAFEYGKGYVYGQMTPKTATSPRDTAKWRVDDHTPCLYAKTIVDKIFSTYGYEYTDDSFFASDTFKRLVVPYTFGALTDTPANVTQRLYQAQVTGATTLSTGQTLPAANDSTGGNFDNGGNYDNTTFEYTAPASGKYRFYLQVESSTSANQYVNFKITTSTQSRYLSIYFDSSGTIFQDAVDIDLVSGDVVTCEYVDKLIYNPSTGNYQRSNLSLDIGISTYWYNETVAATYAYNNTVEFAQFFDGEYTQKEFLLNMFKMFNLYIEQTDTKTLRIETRDDFYNGDNQDWSKKLDYSQPHQLLPMGDLQNNPYKFTYKEGGDEKNKEYKDTYSRIYGDRVVDIDNDFIKQEKKIEVTFNATIMAQDKTSGRYYSDINKEDSSLRILYYGGKKQTAGYYTFNQNPASSPNQTYYPLTLHIDDPSAMSFDLNFGMVQKAYVPVGFAYSNDNLVNKYYYKYISEIGDKNSKIFKGYFRITPNDWGNISFADNYFFEGQYWKLNKITDYRPTRDGVYLCEFLLSTYYTPYISDNQKVGTGGFDGEGDATKDRYPTDGFDDVVSGHKGGVVVGNNSGSDDNINHGDGNQADSILTTTLSSTNTVISKAMEYTTAINCNDYVVPEGNRVYVENQPVLGTWLGSGKVVNIDNTDSPYSATYDDWLILCDTTSGNITVTLPDPTNNSGKMYVIKKTVSSNSVTINAGDGSILIDDATSHTDNAKNGYDQVVSDGTQYWIITHGH